MVVKMARGPEMNPIYHAEYVVHADGAIWYNFSHEGMGDQRPFKDVARSISVEGEGPKCTALTCAAGDDGSSCDYSDGIEAYIRDCKEANDVYVTMC
jgi:hypothetical protein